MKLESESLTTSLEATDALIDESWDWTTLNRIDPGLRNNTTAEFRINIGDSVQDDGSFVGNVWKYWKERDINLKLRKYCEKETENFHKQFSAKILGIYADEETKSSLVKEMMCAQSMELLQEMQQIVQRKYGPTMSACLLQNKPYNGNAEHRFRMTREIIPRISNLVTEVKASLDEMKALDPLHNWYKQKSDISSRMMMRVQNLSSSISNKVQWIFLVQPGHSHSSLESFAVEYDILEQFFEKAKLSSEELSQRAFDQNIPKVRNRKIECVDYTRVKLRSQIDTIKYGSGDTALLSQKPQRITSFSKSTSKLPNNHVQSDFIHANYVSGGPLLNTFILTQAPLLNTMQDFWRMIWQEKSEYIFMLCGASGGKSFTLTDPTALSHCPVYWPRYQGDIMRFGKLTVRNDKVDATADPLFNVTHLTLSMDDNKRDEVKVQHWQWDWREFTDFDWPFRVLLRSRHSKTPTVIHCIDGCGKSGTLILIEIFLMQLLRGTTSCDNPMITSAIFLRLQRRHAVANQMQYLYAYRTVLNWIEPFTISTYHRFVIGWLFKNSGLIGKVLNTASQTSTSFRAPLATMFVLFPLLMFGIMKLLSDIMLNDDADQQEQFQFVNGLSTGRNVNRKSFAYPQSIQAQLQRAQAGLDPPRSEDDDDLNSDNDNFSDTTCLITQASNTDTSLTDESGSDSEQIVMPWREKLPDDLINPFCDKLGDAFNTNTDGRVIPNSVIEGFLAVQAVLIDLERRPKEITGQKRAFQIVLDQQAAHYVLLEWDKDRRCVRLYDSFAPDAITRSIAEWRLTGDIKDNIIAMFGHLFDESEENTTTDSNIRVVIEDGLQQQQDAWSCGLHALGCLLLRIFDKSVQYHDVNLVEVLAFFNEILNSRRPSLEHFRNAEFARQKRTPRRYTPVMVLLDKNSRDVKIC